MWLEDEFRQTFDVPDESLVLTQYVIYQRPRDFPDGWVVRRHHVVHNANGPMHDIYSCVCDSLNEARACVPSFLYRMDRFPGDDPAIVEVWL